MLINIVWQNPTRKYMLLLAAIRGMWWCCSLPDTCAHRRQTAKLGPACGLRHRGYAQMPSLPEGSFCSYSKKTWLMKSHFSSIGSLSFFLGFSSKHKRLHSGCLGIYSTLKLICLASSLASWSAWLESVPDFKGNRTSFMAEPQPSQQKSCDLAGYNVQWVLIPFY